MGGRWSSTDEIEMQFFSKYISLQSLAGSLRGFVGASGQVFSPDVIL